MGRIDDIMCDDITYVDLHLVSVAGIDDITLYDLTYDDRNPECVDRKSTRLNSSH